MRGGNLISHSVVQFSPQDHNRRPQQIESQILLRTCCGWPLQIVVDKTLGFWKYSFGFWEIFIWIDPMGGLGVHILCSYNPHSWNYFQFGKP